ncbi:hypothetical protein L0P10_19395, partial [Eggerthella lenta]|nr:hypothetical protein [Eggerthella lenta]
GKNTKISVFSLKEISKKTLIHIKIGIVYRKYFYKIISNKNKFYKLYRGIPFILVLLVFFIVIVLFVAII